MAIMVQTVVGTAGSVGMPGAPILHFHLKVTTGSGSDATLSWPVSGVANITQSVAPPNGNIEVGQVYGQATRKPHGALTISLTNQAPNSAPLLGGATFAAHFDLLPTWQGTGSFDYEGPATLNQIKIQQVGVPVHGTVVPYAEPPVTPPIVVLYGVALQEAASSGDLATMQALAVEGDKHLAAYGDVQSALAALKAEIARLSGGS